MATLSPESFYDIYHFVVTLIVYVIIALNLLLLKGRERAIIGIGIVIYFIIIYTIPDFYFSAVLILYLFLIAGVKFIAHKEILLGMGIILLLLPRDNPIYIIFSVGFYFITLATFIVNTIALLKSSDENEE